VEDFLLHLQIKKYGVFKISLQACLGLVSKESEPERDKDEVSFKGSGKSEDKGATSTAFKVSHILKNARESHESSAGTIPSSMQFPTGVKTQVNLTATDSHPERKDG
jgi:hypothetical protein